MESEIPQLRVFFFPFMAFGHMIPTLDMAKLFSSRNVKSTIITTPLNAAFFTKPIERAKKNSGIEIDIKVLKFPSQEAGLPEGCENVDFAPSDEAKNMDRLSKFFQATRMMQEQIEQLLEECKPDCLVADMFFPWATETAAKFGIPRLIFHGMNAFAMCVSETIRLYEPHKKVLSDSEPLPLPDFLADITLTRRQLPYFFVLGIENEITKFFREVLEIESKSFGVVINSFYELESAYADHYKNVLGRRTWHIGPLLLCNKDIEDKEQRGKNAAIDQHECLQWLDSKKPNSVLYLCFGSLTNFPDAQLMEIAQALESSGQDFIWVVRGKSNEERNQDWLPEGFEKRMEGKGLIIRGWAPQVLILDRQAIGGFVTHCGWNSMLEGICAGVPMITWPFFAEQFYNERLVTQVLKIGVGVGVQQWSYAGDFVKKEAIEKAVREIMVGDGADEMRNKAKELSEMAHKAVEKGGSSYSNLDDLIQVVRFNRCKNSYEQIKEN